MPNLRRWRKRGNKNLPANTGTEWVNVSGGGRVCTHLESPWKLQLVLESPWISVLTLSNPDSQEPNMKDLQDKIAHAAVELKKT